MAQAQATTLNAHFVLECICTIQLSAPSAAHSLSQSMILLFFLYHHHIIISFVIIITIIIVIITITISIIVIIMIVLLIIFLAQMKYNNRTMETAVNK